MLDYLTESETENFAIRHFEISKEDVEFSKLRDAINGRNESFNIQPGKYTELRDKRNNDVIMTDTPMEWETNRRFIDNAHGRVLVAGLGLGMILSVAQRSLLVKNIIVIEKEIEIIELIEKQFPIDPGMTIIIHDDIFTWKPKRGVRFDTIYFDIWNNICGDNYTEMKKLQNRFRSKLNKENPKAWMDSWRKYDCMRASRRYF